MTTPVPHPDQPGPRPGGQVEPGGVDEAVDFSGCRPCTCGAAVLMPDVHCTTDRSGRGFHRSDMGCSTERASSSPREKLYDGSDRCPTCPPRSHASCVVGGCENPATFRIGGRYIWVSDEPAQAERTVAPPAGGGEAVRLAYRCPQCERLTEWWSDREQPPGNCPWCEVDWAIADLPVTGGPGEPDHETPACTHPDSSFDRTLCAEPCGVMHNYCTECGVCIDECAHQGRPGLDPDEVREWLKDAGARCDIDGPVDDPERLAERIRGLKATVLLRRILALQDQRGYFDFSTFNELAAEARELLDGEK